jgi:hypothetical protein
MKQSCAAKVKSMKREQAQPLSIPALTHSDTSSHEQEIKTLGFEQWLLHKLLERTGNPPVTIVLWNGRQVHP